MDTLQRLGCMLFKTLWYQDLDLLRDGALMLIMGMASVSCVK